MNTQTNLFKSTDGNWVYKRIEIKGRKIRIFCLDEHDRWYMVPRDLNRKFVDQIIVQERKSDSILCTDRSPNDNFVDVIELIPVFISKNEILSHSL